jgi:hypothetical protein
MGGQDSKMPDFLVPEEEPNARLPDFLCRRGAPVWSKLFVITFEAAQILRLDAVAALVCLFEVAA